LLTFVRPREPTVDALTSTFLALRAALWRRLRRCWPASPPELIEEQLGDTCAHMLSRRGYFEAILQRQGAAALERLLFTIAWRGLRGGYKRSAHGAEVPWGDRPIPGRRPAGQDLAAACGALERLVHEAAARYGGRRPEALRRALEDRLSGGEPDTVVAARHGVNRARLCEARGYVRRALL